jgi:hypothetical protein
VSQGIALGGHVPGIGVLTVLILALCSCAAEVAPPSPDAGHVVTAPDYRVEWLDAGAD